MVAYVGGEKQTGQVYSARGSTSWRGTSSGTRVCRAFPFPLELDDASDAPSSCLTVEGTDASAGGVSERREDPGEREAAGTSRNEALSGNVLCVGGGGVAASTVS